MKMIRRIVERKLIFLFPELQFPSRDSAGDATSDSSEEWVLFRVARGIIKAKDEIDKVTLGIWQP